MLDCKTQLVKSLNTILPTYYELFCDSSTPKPCITYIESQNNTVANGDTLGYSTVGYTIKLWGTDLAILMPYTNQIDTTMRGLGYIRTAYNELTFNGNYELIFTYQGLGLENFNN